MILKSSKTQVAARIAELTHLIEEAQLDPVCTADSVVSCINPTTMCQSVCSVFCSPHAPNCLTDKPVRHYINVNGKRTNSVLVNVTLKDKHGNNVVNQSEHLEAVSLEVSHPSIEQEDKGVYKVTYRSVCVRAHTLHIKWRIIQCNIPGLLRDYTNLNVQIPEEELDPELVLNLGDIFSEDTENCSADQSNSPLPKEDELETLTQYGADADEFGLVAGLAYGPNDEFIVVDRDNDKLVVFNKDLQYSHIIGEGEFEDPHGVVCDKSGRVFVVDTGNNRIQVVTLDGKFVTTFGTEGSNNGEFVCSVGLALSSTGLLFVGDTGNRRVQVFATQKTNQFQYSFRFLDYPLVTAYDLVQVALNSAEDKLFVSNLGNSVKVLTLKGGLLYSIVPDLTLSGFIPLSICCTCDGHLIMSNALAPNFVSVYHEDGTLLVTATERDFDPWEFLDSTEDDVNFTTAVCVSRSGKIMAAFANNTNEKLIFDTRFGIVIL